MISFLFVLALAAPSDVLAEGRRALYALDYEATVVELSPLVDNTTLPAPTRARAHLLLAEARFGIAPEADDTRAHLHAHLHEALLLDRAIDFERRDDVSPKLLALFDDERRALLPPPPPPTALVMEESGPPTGWWYATAGFAGAALVAGTFSGGIELHLHNLPPGLSRDDVRATQAAGVTGVVVASAAGVAALATTTAALLE